MINEKDYWNKRFQSRDWEKKSGREQSKFFYELAIKSIPKWLKNDIIKNHFSICDLGCAEGDGTNILCKEFFNSEVSGVDFSESAINIAQTYFPNIKFICDDIIHFKEHFDVIFSSNTFEHFRKPMSIIEKTIELADKYFILIVPFREEKRIDEHLSSFYYNSFPREIGEYQLIYYKEVDCSNIPNTMWPGQQILVVYMKSEYCFYSQITLNEMKNENFDEYLKLSEFLIQKEDELIKIKNLLHKNNQKVSEKEKIIQLKNHTISEKQKIIKNEQEKYRKVVRELKSIHGSDFWKVALKYYYIRDHVWPFKSIFRHVKNHNLKKSQQIKNENIQVPAKTFTNLSSINRDNTKYDIIFFSIINYDYKYHQRPQHIADFFAEQGHQVHYFNTNFSNNETHVEEVSETIRMVNLASKGEYISRTDFSEYLNEVCEELDKYITNYNITDCVVFIEFPNWANLAKHLKEKYGFKIVFDVLDEFTGFHPDDKMLISSFNKLMEISDLVITTSQFLYEKSIQLHENVKIVRNGSEFLHFNNYYSETNTNKRPLIGYYGALAHWFDFEKVEYLSKKRPEYDIILIGNPGDSEESIINNLKKLPNIKFLGSKDYNELPYHLKKFDVALIPFKHDQDLIKATNPVKFYEYLSMGKKVVSTELPELMPFKDKYAYLSNENSKFVEYIDKCVKNEDNLASEKEKIEFARTQDWENRINSLKKNINELYPLSSIIIVTYNNFNYTQKCLESIFKKTAYPNYEIIIVDNKSTDNTRRYLLRLQEKHLNVKVILNEENLGFAKANNIGIKESSGEYIILLNNDTIVTIGWLSGLIKHLDRDKNLGLIGPVTNSIANEAKIKVGYADIKDIDNFANENRIKNMNKLYSKISVLAMFCLALRREIFEEIGPLDELFTIGMFEDDDYSYRAHKKGYGIACADDVFIHHFGGTSFKKLDHDKYMELFEKNKAIFEKKWENEWKPHKNHRNE